MNTNKYKKDPDGEPIHNSKYIKSKLKSDNSKTDADFNDNHCLKWSTFYLFYCNIK